MDSQNITQTIITTINTLFSNLISSIDNSLYAILDDIIFINTDILKTSHFENIFGTTTSSGILLIANSLLIGFILYYTIQLLLSNLCITKAQSPVQFIIKIIFFGICMNSSFFICEQIIFLTSSISTAIREVGEGLFNTNICFSSLITKLNSVIYIEQQATINIFSIDGLIKSIISGGFFTLVFSYSIRYILIKIFVLISPFAILCLSIDSTRIFFKAWIKSFLSLMLIQILVSLILLILFSINFNSIDLFSKFLFVGAIFVLIKANSYVRELLGGISTDLQSGLHNIKGLFKN